MRRNLYFLSLLLVPVLAFSQSEALKNVLNSDDLDQCEAKYEANGLTLNKITIIKDSKISQRAYCFSFLPRLRNLLNKNSRIFRLLVSQPFAGILLVTDEKKISYNDSEGILTLDSDINADILSQADALEKELQKGSPLFDFSGIRKNLEIANLVGWRQCHRTKYSDNGFNISQIKADCNGSKILLACAEINSARLTLAAMGDRDQVFKDVGDAGSVFESHNGATFYFSENKSIGFARAGLPVSRNSCDNQSSSPEDRMCWHTSRGTLSSGYRCGVAEGEAGTRNFERLIFTAD